MTMLTMRIAASESASFSKLPPKKNFQPEYFLVANRGDIKFYIIKGDKNLIAFISLLLIQK